MNILHKKDYAKYAITSTPVSYCFWLTQISLFPFLINWYNGFRNLQKGYFIIINEKNMEKMGCTRNDFWYDGGYCWLWQQ